MNETSAKSADALVRELEYQRQHAEAEQVRATPAKVLDRYRSLRYADIIQKDFMYRALGVGSDIAGKRVLDFGCGSGQTTTQLAAMGAHVVGMDISPELIDAARRRAELDGVSDRVTLMAVDLLASPPPDHSFDLILCSAVLHHVDYRIVLPVLRRCLKPGGKIAIGEPTAMSRTLQRLRDMTPVEKDVSPDEKQFDSTDIAAIAGSFDDSEVHYFNLTSRLIRVIPGGHNLEDGPALSRTLVVGLMRFDRIMWKLPFLRRFYGAVAIIGKKRA